MNKTTDWLNTEAAALSEQAEQQALGRQAELTKPPGALGELESIAVRLAAMQGQVKPKLNNIHISVFAADHGIAASGVSAFPQAVTTEMVKNFSRGGAAISVLAKQLGATLEVINLGTVFDPGSLPGVLDQRIANSTADFSQQAAMSEEQLGLALESGRQAAQRAESTDLFIGGEMGIGNTSSASAIACALLKLPASDLVGPGTGLDQTGIKRKTEIISKALQLHQEADSPLEILRYFGGFEIAALVGSYISCAQSSKPVLVDGFISSVAALLATRLCTNAADWFFYAHASAEPGHVHIMKALNATPLLNMGMRLGEASGAATAVPLLQMACALHNNMATFAEAGVSNKDD